MFRLHILESRMKTPTWTQTGNCHPTIGRAARVALATLSVAALTPVLGGPGSENRVPNVPAQLTVSDDQKVAAHAFATGVQIYECRLVSVDPVPKYSWVFVAPSAVLFADAGGHGEIGVHYGGPTWESESGSKVVAARVDGVTVNPTAIPWLLLHATSSTGPGLFHRISYIQRVNTTGGLPPATGADAAHVGMQVEVPYTAEYYFYRDTDPTSAELGW